MLPGLELSSLLHQISHLVPGLSIRRAPKTSSQRALCLLIHRGPSPQPNTWPLNVLITDPQGHFEKFGADGRMEILRRYRNENIYIPYFQYFFIVLKTWGII